MDIHNNIVMTGIQHFFEKYPEARAAVDKDDFEKLYELWFTNVDAYALGYTLPMVNSVITELLYDIGIDVVAHVAKMPDIPIGCFYSCRFIDDNNLQQILKNKHKISEFAFDNCSNLRNIVIPSNIIDIDNSAFEFTHATKITIEEGCKRIDHSAFTFYEGNSINIPKSVEYLGIDIFRGSKLTDIYYAGNRSDWAKIQKPRGNTWLNNGNGRLSHDIIVHCTNGDIVYKEHK